MAQTQLVYVATTAGLTILSNPGRTERWLTVGQELPEQLVAAVWCDPNQPLALTVQTANEALASADGGQSWQPVATPPPPPTRYAELGGPAPLAFRANPETGRLEYTALPSAEWSPVTVDTTASWTALTRPSFHPDVLLGGTAAGEVWLSTDRGRSWLCIKRDLPPITALAIGRVLS